MKNSIIEQSKMGLRSGAIFIVFLITASTCVAQPVLNFKRVVNNYPTIELYFNVACNGQPEYNFNKEQNFRVVENGIKIGTFSLWCPDPRVRCAISVALVFDASNSMQGTGNVAAKAGGHSFVNKLDGLVDETAVIWFNDTVTIAQGLTTDKTQLDAAIDSLPIGPSTAIWDGIYAGLNELINNSNNPCRAVVAFTDGFDNASTHTPAEIISLANQHRIRIFIVGFNGSSGMIPAQLETITIFTGGQFYFPNPNQVADVYDEIALITFQAFLECLITYDVSCADGALRTVDLTLMNFCNGSDQKTKAYTAHMDSTTFEAAVFRVDTASTDQNTQVQIPIEFDVSLGSEVARMRVAVKYDSSALVFQEFTKDGHILDNIPIQVATTETHIIIQTHSTFQMSNVGNLGVLKFYTKVVSQDVLAPLVIDSVYFESGCLTPTVEDGYVFVRSLPMPDITINGSSVLCDGDSVILSAPDGFSSYQWSTSESSQSISVSSAGDYWVKVMDGNGRYGTSPITTVVVKPLPQPYIVTHGSTLFCLGQSVELEASGNTTFAEYIWSTGESSKTISVDSAGVYSVRVRSNDGCWGTSSAVQTNVTEITVPLVTTGPTRFCEGDSLIISTDGDFDEYEWSNGMSTKSIIVKRPGEYYVLATDKQGCMGYSDTVTVSASDSIRPIIIPSSSTVLCPNDSVILDAGAAYASYTWSTGDTTRSITTKNSGIYFVEVVSNTGCFGMSDTIIVRASVPPEISPKGTVQICNGSSVQLSASHGYSSYRWNTGQQTQQLTVSTSGAYAVTVSDTDGCIMTSAPVVVEVMDSLRPSIIAEGPTEFCEGESVVLDAGQGFATYKWSSGETTRKLKITTSGSFAVSITDTNSCAGTSAPVQVTVHQNPVPMISINGAPELCPGDSVTLDAGQGYSAYHWSTSETTRMIVVKDSGKFSVEVWSINQCKGISPPVSILVLETPPIPQINRNGNVLTTEKADNYQWYLNGSELQGETNQFTVIGFDGSYTVRVFNESGCSSISFPYLVNSTLISVPEYVSSFEVYPDPNSGVLTVEIESDILTDVAFEVINVLGQIVYQYKDSAPKRYHQRVVDIKHASPGLYLLRVSTNRDSWVRRIIRR
jgi:von Willebrand factor type A domain-containing protein/type IX secretion system substrate protein